VLPILSTAFGDVPFLAQGKVSMYGAALLSKYSLGKGTSGVWQVNKIAGQFTVQDREWCVVLPLILIVC
jgi:hypothetical protein